MMVVVDEAVTCELQKKHCEAKACSVDVLGGYGSAGNVSRGDELSIVRCNMHVFELRP